MSELCLLVQLQSGDASILSQQNNGKFMVKYMQIHQSRDDPKYTSQTATYSIPTILPQNSITLEYQHDQSLTSVRFPQSLCLGFNDACGILP